VHATVPGFEQVCRNEMARMLGLTVDAEVCGEAVIKVQPGNVTCALGCLDVEDSALALLSLKSVDHLYAVLFVGNVPELVTAETPPASFDGGDDPQAGDGDGAEAANIALTALRAAVRSVPQATWRAVLRLWGAASGRGVQDVETTAQPQQTTRTFKVVKQRIGHHAFGSTQLAQHVAMAVQASLGHDEWVGVLEDPIDLTVVVKVNGTKLFLGLPLTRNGDVLWKQQAGGVGCEDDDGGGGAGAGADGCDGSSGAGGGSNGGNDVGTVLQRLSPRPLLLPEKRLWVATPLRPPIAYGLVHCADKFEGVEVGVGGLRCGDLLVDPCCGCGTVGEMAAQEELSSCEEEESGKKGTKRVFVLSGDSDSHAVACAAGNVKRAVSVAAATAAAAAARGGERGGCLAAKNSVVLIDVVQWDATRLPLRKGVVDRLVTDLPFGKKCGSRQNNHTLYPRFFKECARVLRTGTRNGVGGGRSSGISSSNSSGSSDSGSSSKSIISSSVSSDSSSSSNNSSNSNNSNNSSGGGGGDDDDARVVVLSADRGSLRRGVETAAATKGGGAVLTVHAEHHLNMGGLNAVVLVLGPSNQPLDGDDDTSGGGGGGGSNDKPSEKGKGGYSGRRRRGKGKRGI
jgi:23S rRNA G2445 N2-methylase RlmL